MSESADLPHAVAIVFPREDRGKTVIQWQVSAEDASQIAAEFRARFGEPGAESTTEADVIDEVTRYINGHRGHVVMDGS
jgi:hypothetical protein